jgi:hypothetical protein
MSMVICSACFDKIVSNRVKDSCINLISVFSSVLFADICDVPMLFLADYAYIISDLPSGFGDAAGFAFSCLGIFVG